MPFLQVVPIGSGSGSSVRVANPYQLKNKAVKIAVLIGPKTGSSGEMTTISFIGKKNAKLFGAASGGYTTGNGMFKLSDGSNLLLASTYVADRNLKRYMKKISPDVIVNHGTDGTDADDAFRYSQWKDASPGPRHHIAIDRAQYIGLYHES